MDSITNVLEQIRDQFCYCGVSKTEYRSVRTDAFISNFVVWKYLHILLIIAFGVMGTLAVAFNETIFDILSRYIMCGYCIMVSLLFKKVFKAESIAAQRIIYLTIVMMFFFGLLSGLEFPDNSAVLFMVLLVVLPMFIIDPPYRMVLVLITAAIVYSVLAFDIKTGRVFYLDTTGVWMYALLGCIINFFYNNIRVREFLLVKQEKKHLQDEVEANKTKQLMSATLGKMSESILELLGDVVESRDHESGDHSYRVRGFAHILANQVKEDLPEYGLTKHDVNLITYTSILHDVGKISISDTILLKPDKLSKSECAVMKTHCEKGCQILEKMEGSWAEDYLNTAMDICLFHHEKWDGKGYPYGLSGDDIPISAQIVSIADIYDALTSERVYKRAYSYDEAYDMITSGQCGAFSEKIMGCFAKCRERFEEHAEYPSTLDFDDASLEITTEGSSETKPQKILVGLHNEDKTLQENKRLEEELAIISSLSEEVYYLCYVDIEKKEVIEFNSSEEFRRINDSIDFSLRSNVRFDKLLREVIVPIDFKRFRTEIDREKVLETIAKEGNLIADFRIMLHDGIHFSRMKITMAPNRPGTVIVGIFNIDEIHKKSAEAIRLNEELEASRIEIREKELLKEHLAVISCISTDYDLLCSLNTSTMEVTIYHIEEWLGSTFENIGDIIVSPDAREEFLKNVVLPEGFDEFIKSSCNAAVKEALRKNKTYTVNFRARKNGKKTDYRIRYVKDPKNPDLIIIGLHELS